MIEAVIFDMDGVIVDSESLWEKALKKYLIEKNKTLPPSREFKTLVNNHFRGRSQKHIVGFLKKKFSLKDSHQKIFHERIKTIINIFDEDLEDIPGAFALIRLLHRNNYPLLLASSSPKKVINYVVRKYELRQYFKHFISGDDFGKGKPNPEIFLKGAKLLKAKPENILVIEDSISGIRAAVRAGMKCIVLKHPYNSYASLQSTNLIVKSLKEITLQTIKKL